MIDYLYPILSCDILDKNHCNRFWTSKNILHILPSKCHSFPADLADEAYKGFKVQRQRREAELIDLVPGAPGICAEKKTPVLEPKVPSFPMISDIKKISPFFTHYPIFPMIRFSNH